MRASIARRFRYSVDLSICRMRAAYSSVAVLATTAWM